MLQGLKTISFNLNPEVYTEGHHPDVIQNVLVKIRDIEGVIAAHSLRQNSTNERVRLMCYLRTKKSNVERLISILKTIPEVDASSVQEPSQRKLVR